MTHLFGMTHYEDGWTKDRIGWHRPSDENVYVWGSFTVNGEKTPEGLWFWDWSQRGEDCCYGQGKWMPVTDQSIIDSFPKGAKK